MVLKVAIVGRPNVGKSTLFNRLAGRKIAIVHDEPGVTRDRKMAPAKLHGLALEIIDTAGYEYSKEDNIEKRMWEQTQKAIDDADVVLFLFDARAGIQPYDEHFADLVRQTHKPVVLLANKCEGKPLFLAVSLSSIQVRRWDGTTDSSSLRRTLFQHGRRTSTLISTRNSSRSVMQIRLSQQAIRVESSRWFLLRTAFLCLPALSLRTR